MMIDNLLDWMSMDYIPSTLERRIPEMCCERAHTLTREEGHQSTL